MMSRLCRSGVERGRLIGRSEGMFFPPAVAKPSQAKGPNSGGREQEVGQWLGQPFSPAVSRQLDKKRGSDIICAPAGDSGFQTNSVVGEPEKEGLVGLDKVCRLWYTNSAFRTLTVEEWQVRER